MHFCTQTDYKFLPVICKYMQFYTLNMFMHVYNKRGRDFLHEQFYFKFLLILFHMEIFIQRNTNVLCIMFYFTGNIVGGTIPRRTPIESA